MASVWTEKYKNKHGVSYIMRWEWAEPDPADPAKTVTLRDSKVLGPSRQYANDQVEAKRKELVEGAPASRPEEMGLGAAVDAYLADAATYKKERTVKNFDRPALTLLRAFADEKRLHLRLGDLRGDDMVGRRVVLKRRGTSLIRAWKLWLMAPNGDGKARYGAHSTDMWMRAGSTFLNYYGLHPNPFDQVERPAVDEVGVLLTDAQVRRVPEIVPWRVARAMLLAFMSGLRRSGVLSLDFRQVRVLPAPKPEAAAEVTVTEKSRAGKPLTRTVDIPAAALACLAPIRDTGPVFPGLTENVISHYTKDIAKALGVPRFRFHDCRHNWGTRAARRLTLDDWMRQGGWKSLSSAKAYLHHFRARREEGPIDYGLPIDPPIKLDKKPLRVPVFPQ